MTYQGKPVTVRMLVPPTPCALCGAHDCDCDCRMIGGPLVPPCPDCGGVNGKDEIECICGPQCERCGASERTTRGEGSDDGIQLCARCQAESNPPIVCYNCSRVLTPAEVYADVFSDGELAETIPFCRRCYNRLCDR